MANAERQLPKIILRTFPFEDIPAIDEFKDVRTLEKVKRPDTIVNDDIRRLTIIKRRRRRPLYFCITEKILRMPPRVDSK